MGSVVHVPSSLQLSGLSYGNLEIIIISRQYGEIVGDS